MIKQEEDQRRMREQFERDLEVQKQQMDNMLEANMNELQREREAMAQQNRSLEEAVQGMKSAMEARNNEVQALQRSIEALNNRPVQVVKRGRGGCIVM